MSATDDKRYLLMRSEEALVSQTIWPDFSVPSHTVKQLNEF
jgi:hypothetical protein